MAHRKGYITRQAQRLSDGEINRRRFVMSALSAGVTMPTALSLASKAEAHAPKPGGTLRLALSEGALTDSLDPVAADNAFTRLLAFARGNTLTEVTAEGDVIGELADHFSASEDKTHWQFHLRTDAKFQSGAALTAADVAASLTRAAHMIPSLEGIETDGAHRLVLTLAKPEPDLPRHLADPKLAIQTGGVGTGPYRLEFFEPGTHARLTRNPDYWKAGRAHFDAIEMRVYPDVSARQQAVMMNDADYADGIDPRALALLQHTPEVALLNVATGRHIAVELHETDAGLCDHILHHLPDAEVVDRLLLGHGSCGLPENRPTPVTASPKHLRLGVSEDGVPRSQDIARLVAARLTEAGHEVEIIANPGDRPVDLSLRWTRDTRHESSGLQVTLAWANDLSAYRAPLSHGGQIGSNAENDGARLIERWWFS
ncbi:MAG: ABC transporter substrate-binding protein [Pseudomonadota bacterium]